MPLLRKSQTRNWMEVRVDIIQKIAKLRIPHLFDIDLNLSRLPADISDLTFELKVLIEQ